MTYTSIKISKIVGCALQRVGELPYDFYFGACGTFQFTDASQERALLCFPAKARNKCYRFKLFNENY